ncbi:MAG TPA: FAD-binding oxidoreductase [Anaerolinea thermolimosa]|uniref:D-lactate dehydrogenase (cytochrome) n=1 Tax=Anaerolinea thermolimosa TaxID=229919 RepID=A0A3D1JFJ0_9CHLR|nr:FAD-binding and (Fe-S)-binding domain-containing protein [Anaerolinea thermolimosa]GAP08189.1 FAD/FMN-containing dehydrogenase [Anaerolinea thermolimosa]HCE16528.1 FAD-binding oxidoreductase [Anaerolinea thermolimosa]
MNLDADLRTFLSPRQILTRPIDRVAFASDASFYRLIPQAVVQPRTLAEVRALFDYSRKVRIPLCFRAAGTSLAGQAITDGLLVDISRYWRKIEVEEGGLKIRLGPGVVGSDANLALKPYARRIGPDPASIDAAMLGGMVANNASGMCCGVVENSYHTLASLTFMLPSGVTIDTAAPDARQQFEEQAPEVVRGLLELRDEILANPDLVERIRAKYRQKNTTGYSLNAFLDFDSPEQIFAHLLVGSEGTLGFIAEVVLHTLPAYPLKYTALLLFETVRDAAAAVFPLRDSGARAIEIMDRAALRSVENEPGIAELLQDLPENAAGLLVEYQTETPASLDSFKEAAAKVCASLRLLRPASFTTDPAQQAVLWNIRKGLFPSIGGMRRQGTTVLIEDVAFRVEQLADAILDLQALFQEHHYPEAIIFGHAKDGNLHFVLTPSFNDEASVEQYARFMDALVNLVVNKYDGALKAEHGTGRNMAPFVEAEWGRTAWEIMARLKKLVDPENLLNPGVVINPDPHCHLDHLKPWPIVEAEVDKCIECGFCEPKCPSRDLTLTPRQRIVVRREITRLMQSDGEADLLESLIRDYQYSGLETCAVDGYCALACPVHINTGLLVKRLRAEHISPRGHAVASGVSRHFKAVETGLRLGVGLGHVGASIIGHRGVAAITRLAEKVAGTALPKWSPVVPRPNFKPLPRGQRKEAEIVYFPSCIVRAMGSSPRKGEPTLIEVFTTLADRAGLKVWIPEDSPGNCCGMPFSSKGYVQAFRETLHRTVEHFWDWSEEGRKPVVIDSSSCAYTLLTSQDYLAPEDRSRWERMTLLDPLEFTRQMLLPRLTLNRVPGAVVLHPNCSAVKLGLQDVMLNIARACAEEVVVPQNLKCCGYAGDRGLLFPELTASASAREAAEVLQREYTGYYSSNLTCEMGMAQATGRPYQSILYLVEKASR